LDKLIGSQVIDISKKGLGYVSYNAVPPPHTGRFSPPRIDLSHTILPEFVELSVQGYRVKPIEVESDEEDEVESPPEKERKNVEPSVDKGHSHRQIEDQGYFDSGCFRHMTGNISCVTDFKEFDGGYVAFGGGAKGGKITGKGTIKTGKLDFKDVYFVKELQFNLFSVSQMCDKKNSVLFTDTECFVQSLDFKFADESHVLLKVPRKNNMYSVDMKNIVLKKDLTCLVAKATNDESMLWHRRLGHNFKNINKLVKGNLVRELPSKHFENDQTCVVCLKGKQHKVSSKSKIQNSIYQPLFMLHMDLFGPTSIGSIMHKKYCLVITDDFNRFTWNRVLVVKPHFKTPYKLFRGRTHAFSFMRPFGCHVTILNTLDHLGKFDGKSDEGFLVGYSTNSKAFRVYNTRTRKVEENLHIKFFENKSLIAGDRPKWLFEIDTLIELMNYVPVIAGTTSNDFVGKGATFNAGQSSMETRPSQDYILMPLWNDGLLFDSSPKASDGDNQDNDGPNTKSEIDNQKRPNAEHITKDINTVGPSINTASLNFNTASPTVNTVRLSDDFFGADNAMRSLDRVELDISNISTLYPILTTLNTRINKDHSLDTMIEKTHEDLHTCLFACFLSQEEPKRITNVLKDPAWVEAINKKDERGIVIRNKARLVAQGCTQEEGIDYNEVFAPVVRIEAIRLFLAYASFMGFLVYQMDNKSAFLYGRIEEEVYVCQPPRFEDLDYPDKVYKVKKALYGLHRALRAWYKTLAKYFLDNGFRRGKIDQTLFIKRQKADILLIQVYVDDIIFGSTKKELCTEFEKLDVIFISQDNYVDEILRKFKYDDVKPASTLMDKEKDLLKDSDGDDVDVHLYRPMIRSLMYLTSSRPDIMFTCTASARTLDNREIKLNATVDGQVKTITEASVRRHLKLVDVDSISTLPTIEIFEQLDLMGVETTLFPTMLVTEQVSQGEGPTSIIRTQHIPTIIESTPHLQNISITYKKTRTRTGRMGIKIPQSNVPSSAANEAITKEMHDGLRRATTIASILAAEQGSGIVMFKLGLKGYLTCLMNHHLEKGRMIEEIDKYENVNLVKSSELWEAHKTTEHRMDLSTASQTDDDETLAETLLNIKRSATKDKGEAIIKESESPKKIKKKEMMQISLDEKIAQRFYEEEQA
nr:hypothetical protein [Tanacetum cinerariifolium]